jgi:hypothetical protein
MEERTDDGNENPIFGWQNDSQSLSKTVLLPLWNLGRGN